MQMSIDDIFDCHAQTLGIAQITIWVSEGIYDGSDAFTTATEEVRSGNRINIQVLTENHAVSSKG
jgi:hypothetical protein